MKNFVVYRSSAGSGKTFTLVKEYLRLALHDEKKLNFSFKRILAITFTNKAAAEMKSRVLSSLEGISHKNEKYATLTQLLCQGLKTGTEELSERAAIVLSAILHNYSDFAIGTIDSFTHKIVKTFAHDLKLPVNFNVELDTKSFYDKVVAMLFSRVGEDKEISKLLQEFVLGRAENNSHWDPERQIQEFSALLQKESSEEYLQKLRVFELPQLELFRKQFSDYCKFYEGVLKQDGERALQLISKNGFNDNHFRYKKTGPQNFFRKCFNGTATLQDAGSARLKEALEQNKWGDKDNRDLESIIPQLHTLAKGLVDFMNENHSYYSLCKLLAGQMYSLMLLKKIEEISVEQKQEERLVFISEFNQRIFNIINNEPTPFVYERLGERYQHYLLDEFQDTSSLQWQNILPLVDNSLSSGWFNLIVGDGKQSIYRWRNANVKQFASLPDIENTQHNPITGERGDVLKRNFEEKILGTNFRSLREVVEFNNDFFTSLSDKLLLEEMSSIYANLKQEVRNTNSAGGYVQINTTSLERGELDSYTFTQTFNAIQNALQSGFSYGDICILMRKNTLGNLVAAQLMDKGIPVESSDSLLLKNHPAIQVMVSLLKYLANPGDAISAAVVLNYLRDQGRIQPHEIHAQLTIASKPGGLFAALKKCNINISPSSLALNNLADNCVYLINALELQKEAHHYLRFFLDEVNEFLLHKNNSNNSFIDWWQLRSKKASLVIPEGSDAVKVMTIHASKGLEFPVVIIPYCNWSVYQASDNWVNIENEKVQLPVSVISLTKKAGESGFTKELMAEEAEQILDNLNLLYVAFTRAIERLHVFANPVTGNHQKTINLWLQEYLNEKALNSSIFETGIPSPKQHHESSEAGRPFYLKPLLFETPYNLIKIKGSYLKRRVTASLALQKGVLMHWLLSFITCAQDIEPTIEKALREGKINQEESLALKNKLSDLLNHPKLSPFFVAGIESKTEAEIITSSGEILRPDRLVFEKERALILEYKTGGRHDDNYAGQLLRYENALIDMGYKNIKKVILYLDEPEVVEVN